MSSIKYDFSGENFVVTGASSGMGRQIALDLAKAGAKVLAVARREEELKKLQEEYPDYIFIAPADVCDLATLDIAVSSFVKNHGKLKGAVHCAGIEGFTPLRAFDYELAKKVVEISFWGGINLSQVVNKKKNSLPKCSTVLFSSVASMTGEKSLFAYSSAKAAMNTAVKSLAKEICTDGKRINTILPGWVKTNMTNGAAGTVDIDENVFRRHLLGMGEPKDVANSVMFLLSDDARWITGSNFVIDGGYLAGV